MTNAREKGIVRTSIVGIVGNLVLTGFKLLVGVLANSIAIILDGVNNATDALSSIITIVGTKIAGRRADREHPFGYGRIEYVTSVAIALIILAAGIVSLRESVIKIISPADPDYNAVTLIVIVASIVAKIVIGLYFRRRGAALRSEALRASGIDSDYDAVLSAGTLVAALVMMLWHVNVDGLVGALISLFVLKAGIDILRDAMGPIIGARGDDARGREMKEFIRSFPDVEGVCDLIVDDFGPNEGVGAVHIEVDERMDARRIEELSRSIEEAFFDKYRIILTVGIYAVNASASFTSMERKLRAITAELPSVLDVHGFYVDQAAATIDFDLVVDFDADGEAVRDAVVTAMEKTYPAYRCNARIDADYLD